MILIVDDSAATRETLAKILRQEDLDAVGIGSTREALLELAKARPELIILDLRMPGMDGLAMLQVMKKNPLYQKIPVIILTGIQDRAMILRAAKLGVKDYLLKGRLDVPDLIRRVRTRMCEAKIDQDGEAA